MIIGILVYLLIGFILAIQHFYRSYYANKSSYKGKICMLSESKGFYLTSVLLWPWGLDFLLFI